jgi:hypothetical protein
LSAGHQEVSHVDELDVVACAVSDGLIHLLVLGDALLEVTQSLKATAQSWLTLALL